MESFLPYLFSAIPYLVVLTIALIAVAGMGFGLVAPRMLVYPYLAIFFFFNSTSYGSLSVLVSAGVYTRGSGVLLFPVILWGMLGVWCCARVSASFQRYPAPPCNLRPWFFGWLVLLAAHVAVALFLGQKLSAALAPSGFSNVVWMAPLVSLMLLSFRTREHAVELARFVMLAGLGRALYGLGRWAVGGGDPNNVYANMNAVKIKLTFFDINDSLLCCLAFSIAAVHLFQAARIRRSQLWVGIEWLTLLSTALCIMLSYRRTAWLGLLLAMLILLWRFPPRRRLAMILAGAPLLAVALGHVAVKRLSQTAGAGGGLESLVYDMQSRRFGAESERVLELKLAFSDFLAHFLTGIGSWGKYAGYQRVSWQAGHDGGQFVHSGLLHVALKSGLPGTVLLIGTVLAFVAVARRALRELPPELMGLGAAGACGIAFMLPDFLLGTPIPQVRTTQMLAICLALPYLALSVKDTVGVAGRVRPAFLGRTTLAHA